MYYRLKGQSRNFKDNLLQGQWLKDIQRGCVSYNDCSLSNLTQDEIMVQTAQSIHVMVLLVIQR